MARDYFTPQRESPHWDYRHLAWTVSSTIAKPSADEVHVWRISLEQQESRIEHCCNLLSDDELERAGKFRFKKDRDQFVVAHGTLRQILGHCLHLSPKRLIFERNFYGKPEIRRNLNSGDLTFNLSHSGNLALLTLSFPVRDGYVGQGFRSCRRKETALPAPHSGRPHDGQ
jgi:phosphopantetheinyl transferase